MKYTKIEKLAQEVSAVSLGMADIGAGIPEHDGFKLLDMYLDMGGNLLDTARVYSDWVPGEAGRSERVLGDWLALRGNRSRVVLATKGAHPRLGSIHTPRMSRAEVEVDLDLSLKALRTDTIDIYYLHRDDRSRPVEEILYMLEGFASSGKILRYACSNWRADRMLEAYECSRRHGWQGFAANQIFWNLGSVNCTGQSDDTCEAFNDDMLSAFVRTGIVAAAYSSQAGGFFTKMERGVDVSGSIYDTPGNMRVYRKAAEIASRTGMTIADIALCYILCQPIPTIAVVGCRNMEQLTCTMAAANRTLPAELLQEIEDAVAGNS